MRDSPWQFANYSSVLANEYIKVVWIRDLHNLQRKEKRFIFIELLDKNYSVLTQLSHKVKCARAKSFLLFLLCEYVWWQMIGKKCLATNSLLAKTCMRVEFNMANYGCKAGGNSDTFNACPYFHFFFSFFFYLALVCFAFFDLLLLLFLWESNAYETKNWRKKRNWVCDWGAESEKKLTVARSIDWGWRESEGWSRCCKSER